MSKQESTQEMIICHGCGWEYPEDEMTSLPICVSMCEDCAADWWPWAEAKGIV